MYPRSLHNTSVIIYLYMTFLMFTNTIYTLVNADYMKIPTLMFCTLRAVYLNIFIIN